MSTKRERFFRCRSQDAGTEELVLQAWDAQAAARAYREALRRGGLSSAVAVEVEELAGRPITPGALLAAPAGA
ncbi:hypothetical protein [Anaeromyxobacter paludicola]|uniref:Uncharacterized protein n=1 Tax=Anaeromyxobacter paludicola TaxID=2918171 RepID=A0ABM7XBS7_9BACT|nr:hypothetical protein [Anaeromyxobacter paludicola]BDG09320.1 hypothetical protein AMPC_24330 [Anaeromyxobacter paludicola]